MSPVPSGRSKALTRAPGDSKTVTHGGQREGAGRPQKPDRLIRQSVYLEQRHMYLISKLQNSLKGATFSQALRSLLDRVSELESDDEELLIEFD